MELRKDMTLRIPLNLAFQATAFRSDLSNGVGSDMSGPAMSRLRRQYDLAFFIILGIVVAIFVVSMLIRFAFQPAAEVPPHLSLASTVRLQSQESAAQEYETFAVQASEKRELEAQVREIRQRVVEEAVKRVVATELDVQHSKPKEKSKSFRYGGDRPSLIPGSTFVSKETKGFVSIPSGSGQDGNPQTPGATIKADLGYIPQV
mmetsp:Transcript_30788/g.48245  ORF Transcript_30788/g.48245 Transcript_30788/m.48245 type:complete len:204 (+) Transcript_30788:1-612(+)